MDRARESTCSTFRRELFLEMKNDLARRWPHYRSDWIDGYSSKVFSASLYMFFTSIAPAITFSAEMLKATEENGEPQIGPPEVLLSTALTGIIFSIFGGQPLCIVGVTGPVTVFTAACFTISQSLGVKFLPFYCWVQIWSALMHIALAATNACRAISLVSRFACETFGMLIASIYIYNGIANLSSYFHKTDKEGALASLLLGLATAWLALILSNARRWSFFTVRVRTLIADYSATFSVLAFCAMPYMTSLASVGHSPHNVDIGVIGTRQGLVILDVSSTFGPTAAGRSWVVNPFECPPQFILLAIFPGFFLTVLFFFDHNVSSLLCQASEFQLKKGSAYHWDFAVVGAQVFVTGLLGIPPVNGLIPQAPLHTDSLCDKAFRKDERTGAEEEVVLKCHEQRVSNLSQAVLIGCICPGIKVIRALPCAVLDGLFIFMGIASFSGNTFYERCLLFITERRLRGARKLPYTDGVDSVSRPGLVNARVIKMFTLIQLAILAAIFLITQLPLINATFPLLIAILVPLRRNVLPRLFGTEAVDALDFQDGEGAASAQGEPTARPVGLAAQGSAGDEFYSFAMTIELPSLQVTPDK